MGGLAAKLGPRIPLTVGPLVIAAGMVTAVLIKPDASYWIGAFPTILVMALGMTIAVAPLTSSVLGSVEEQHVAMASGFNSAVARTGGLIATALLGAVLASSGEKLFSGFHAAMLISAGVAAVGALVALTMLGGVRMKKAG
jgi:hypothetical protein